MGKKVKKLSAGQIPAIPFTDRDLQRKAIREKYNQLQMDEFDVINFYGVGGIGKSSLLQQVNKELEETGDNVIISYNFEAGTNVPDILYSFEVQMEKSFPGISFDLFHYALLHYLDISGVNEEERYTYRKEMDKNPAAYESDVAMTCNNLAVLLSDTGREEEAEKLYQEMLEIFMRYLTEEEL